MQKNISKIGLKKKEKYIKGEYKSEDLMENRVPSQSELKQENIKKVVDVFLQNPLQTISDVSEKTNIPRSSVQRYLTDEYVDKLGSIYEIKDLRVKIKEFLEETKKKGHSKGGKTTQDNYVASKDSIGKFTGLIKQTKEEKINDIINYYFSKFKNIDETENSVFKNIYLDLKEIGIRSYIINGKQNDFLVVLNNDEKYLVDFNLLNIKNEDIQQELFKNLELVTFNILNTGYSKISEMEIDEYFTITNNNLNHSK